ncbi:MAG: hypothetical protein P1U57_05290, partial [Oleibacter sp.]|nr:hypothetical protein [Thalassolituus sp.]
MNTTNYTPRLLSSIFVAFMSLWLTLFLVACGGSSDGSTNARQSGGDAQVSLRIQVSSDDTVSASANAEDINSLVIRVLSGETLVQTLTLDRTNPTALLTLAPGSYDIEVDALDIDGQPLSFGEVNLPNVVAGGRYSATISLIDLISAVISEDISFATLDDVSNFLVDVNGFSSGASFILPLSGSNSFGDISVYSWSIASGPDLSDSSVDLTPLLNGPRNPSLIDPANVFPTSLQQADGVATELNYFRSFDSAVVAGNEDSVVVRLTVTDSNGQSTFAELPIKILYADLNTTINQPPVVNAPSDFVVDMFIQSQPSINLNASDSFDPEQGSLIYLWEITDVVNSPANINNNLDPILTGADTVNATLTWLSDAYGAITITQSVTDDAAQTATESFVITIGQSPVPSVIADSQNSSYFSSDASATLDAGSSSDIQGQPLTFTWAIQNSAPGLTITPSSDTTTAEITWPSDFVGSLFIETTVTNADGLESITVTTIEVVGGLLPTADAGGDQLVDSSEFFEFVLDGSASSDPELGPLTYSWVITSFEESPANGSLTLNPVLTNDNTANPTLSWDSGTFGNVFIDLTVTDDGGQTSTDSIVVTISAAPFAIAFAEGSSFPSDSLSTTLFASQSGDPQGQPLTYAWEILTADPDLTVTPSTDGSTADVAWPEGFEGDIEIQLTVTNTDGLSSTDVVTINVFIPIPDLPPTADAGGDQLIDSSILEVFEVVLDGSASSDPELAPLTYSWIITSVEESTGNPSNVLNPVLTNADQAMPTLSWDSFNYGNVFIDLIVTDDGGQTSTDSIVVQISSSPFASVNANQPSYISDDLTATFDGLQSGDPQGQSLIFTW